jgi:hypothetical protein
MRSYYSHLETLQPEKRPDATLRASAIFPAFQSNEVSTRLIFLGYWQLKRNISELRAQTTIRDQKGQLISQKKWSITSPKAYQVELRDFIKAGPFLGTIELEFFSPTDLVFPYPAVAVNYYGPAFSSVVHTAQRVYNNPEDARRNSENHVPESGFAIYCNDNTEPFVTLINGSESVPAQTLHAICYNALGDTQHFDIELEAFAPYELRVLYPSQWFDLNHFLKGRPGTFKLDFKLGNIFPRLVAGNKLKRPEAYVITHSYYDCSSSNAASDFWTPSDPDWYPASLMFPVVGGSYFTSFDLYPVYAPSAFSLDLELYRQNGDLIVRKERFITVNENMSQFKTFPLDAEISSEIPCAARLIAQPLTDRPIPARIKVAINIGVKGKGLPCNICTNLQPFVPAFTNKKQSFKWLPILADQPRALNFIMHSSPAHVHLNPNTALLSFYRESDGAVMTRNVLIPPHGFYVIDVPKDEELKQFLQGKVGWATLLTSNPYSSTYYFAENPSGIIGGDHGF